LNLEKGNLTASELRRANELIRDRYDHADWMKRV